jgi:hypothetical protein
MSFLPDLTPLIQQIKEFNQNQLRTNQLLTAQNQLLTEIKQLLQNKK